MTKMFNIHFSKVSPKVSGDLPRFLLRNLVRINCFTLLRNFHLYSIPYFCIIGMVIMNILPDQYIRYYNVDMAFKVDLWVYLGILYRSWTIFAVSVFFIYFELDISTIFFIIIFFYNNISIRLNMLKTYVLQQNH